MRKDHVDNLLIVLKCLVLGCSPLRILYFPCPVELRGKFEDHLTFHPAPSPCQFTQCWSNSAQPQLFFMFSAKIAKVLSCWRERLVHSPSSESSWCVCRLMFLGFYKSIYPQSLGRLMWKLSEKKKAINKKEQTNNIKAHLVQSRQYLPKPATATGPHMPLHLGAMEQPVNTTLTDVHCGADMSYLLTIQQKKGQLKDPCCCVLCIHIC